jgi:glycosyltransferase involved in cell wall biosynthesis
MKVSVLIPYFQGRRPLLERTLWLLRNQTYEDFEVWILDDGSNENVEELCGGKIIYEKLRDYGAPPRASNMAWNHAYRKCDGEFIILTHPEYMAPRHAIETLVDLYDGDNRLEPVALALPSHTLGTLDELDWKSDLDVLMTVPDFWTFRTPLGLDKLRGAGMVPSLRVHRPDQRGLGPDRFHPGDRPARDER